MGSTPSSTTNTMAQTKIATWPYSVSPRKDKNPMLPGVEVLYHRAYGMQLASKTNDSGFDS